MKISEENVFAAMRAFDVRFGYSKLERMRDALEAVGPQLAARPVIDRDAVAKVLRELACWRDPHDEVERYTDAVMELARPLPTRTQIDAVLGAHFLCNDHGTDLAYVRCHCGEWEPLDPTDRATEFRAHLAGQIEALMNGAES